MRLPSFISSIVLTILIFPVSAISAETGKSRSIVGTDLSSPILRGAVRIAAGHGIRDRWSLEGEVGMNLKLIAVKREDEEESDHRLELLGDVNESPGFRDTFIDISVLAGYWPKRCFEGLCLQAGYSYKDRGGPDCCIGAGYAVNIWKGITFIISYRFRLIETYRKQTTPSEGLKISINYVF